MKTLYSLGVAMIAVVLFATGAIADPGNTWDKKFDAAGRFHVLSQFNNAAVLDRETGRVWEQSPIEDNRRWSSAHSSCYEREIGGRLGWRLPTIEELASLVDRSQQNPALPAGHPFSKVQFNFYWSATTDTLNPSAALLVDLGTGEVERGTKELAELHFWCVRGGQGIDGVQ